MCMETPNMARNGPYHSTALLPLYAQCITPFTEPSNNLPQKQATRACNPLQYTTPSPSQQAKVLTEGGGLTYAQVDVRRSVEPFLRLIAFLGSITDTLISNWGVCLRQRLKVGLKALLSLPKTGAQAALSLVRGRYTFVGWLSGF